MNSKFGMLRLTTITPRVQVGNPAANADEILASLKIFYDSDIVLTPELSITGYTCGDLFGHETLIRAAWDAVIKIAVETKEQLVVVGCPIRVEGGLYNCGVVLGQGYVLGIIPKSYLPGYKEFYEPRWFQPADGTEPKFAQLPDQYGTSRPMPFGTNLLFRCEDIVVGVEVCEDLWVPLPPSSFQAVAGANVLLNLSASNELVGKGDYRKKLIENQSARCVAAYAYCSSGPLESTADVVFGGHNLVYENGTLLAEASKFKRDCHSQTVDIDIGRLNSERAKTNSFSACRRSLPKEYVFEDFCLKNHEDDLTICRVVNANVFVPNDGPTLKDRCQEIFGIQAAGLAKRLQSLPNKKPTVTIGVSGGLDSTLALLVAVKAFDLLNYDRHGIKAITMPGFGTTGKTLKNAKKLMEVLGVWEETVDIRALSIATFETIGHQPFGIEYDDGHPEKMLLENYGKKLEALPPDSQDLIFENVQARLRTLVLMSKGFVVGTGDMSELALGWCTYNGDHMSMYNPNCSVPKTLVRFLVEWVARHEHQILCPMKTADEVKYQEFRTAGELKECLLDICKTIISPELLPGGNQDTEKSVGPYELNDFFLFHMIRNAYPPAKILWLAGKAEGFSRDYKKDELKHWLGLFMRRFFAAQFKRECVPNGPKVGSVSLSPRGDWRMPPDCDPSLWL